MTTAAYYAANRDKVRAAAAAHYAANRERYHIKDRARYQASKEKCRAYAADYRAANRDRCIAACAAWRATNPDKHKSDFTKWYAANRDQSIAKVADWSRKNPDRRCDAQSRRHARKLRAMPAWLTDEQRDEILDWYQHAAQLKLSVDHIVPLQGKNVCGLHVPWNMQLLPRQENASKGNRF